MLLSGPGVRAGQPDALGRGRGRRGTSSAARPAVHRAGAVDGGPRSLPDLGRLSGRRTTPSGLGTLAPSWEVPQPCETAQPDEYRVTLATLQTNFCPAGAWVRPAASVFDVWPFGRLLVAANPSA